MNTLIVSPGSMLSSGTQNPSIPGTDGAAKASVSTRSSGVGRNGTIITAAPSISAVTASPAVTKDIRAGNAAVQAMNKPQKYPGAQAFQSGGDKGPSTFQQKVLGGHLPMSWLTAGPKGR